MIDSFYKVQMFGPQKQKSADGSNVQQYGNKMQKTHFGNV